MWVFGLEKHLGSICVAEYRPERLIDLMRNRRGQFTDGSEARSMSQLSDLAAFAFEVGQCAADDSMSEQSAKVAVDGRRRGSGELLERRLRHISVSTRVAIEAHVQDDGSARLCGNLLQDLGKSEMIK